MAEKVYENNGNIMYLYFVLKKYSDINHPLSKLEIIDKIRELYNVSISDRTVRRNIKVLCEKFNYVVSCENGSYYLEPCENDFEKSEIQTIIDIITYSKFVNDDLSSMLSKKLYELLNYYDKESFKNYKKYVKSTKTDNKQIFYTIDIISDSIESKKAIEVDYYKYNLKKELEFRNKIIVSPYIVIFDSGQYYLVGYHHIKKVVAYFRIDRIKNVKVSSNKYVSIKDNFITDKLNSTVGMYSGKVTEIKAIVNNQLLDDVIEKFGRDVVLRKYDDNNFLLEITTGLDGFKYWTLRNISYVKVISPLFFKEQIIDILNSSIKNYSD